MKTKDRNKLNKNKEKLEQERLLYIYGDIIREFKYSTNRDLVEAYNIYLRLATEKWNKILKYNMEKKKEKR